MTDAAPPPPALPDLSEPHLRITQPPHLMMHPAYLSSVPPTTPLPVFQYAHHGPAHSKWTHLGTYRLLRTMCKSDVRLDDVAAATQVACDSAGCGDTSFARRIVYAYGDAGLLELVVDADDGDHDGVAGQLEEILYEEMPLPVEKKLDVPQLLEEGPEHEVLLWMAPLPTPPAQYAAPQEGAPPPLDLAEVEMVVNGGPDRQKTPVAVSASSSVLSIPSSYLATAELPTPPHALESDGDTPPATPAPAAQVAPEAAVPEPPALVPDCLAGVHLVDIVDQDFSDDDDDSDRWSVLSTGPVDRQWTVVFEEKDEVV